MKKKRWKGFRLAALLASVLLACTALAGCQTSQMKEEAADSQEDTVDSAGKSKEDEYIDASNVEDGSDEDEDFGKYKSGKKSKSAKSESTEDTQGSSGQAGDKESSGGGESGQQDAGGSAENTSEGQSMYNTDPIPEGKPEPVEPQDNTVDFDQSLSCTLYVECSNILNNMDDLADGKDSLVPSDGVIYGPATVTFYEGESVYDVLLREMQDNRIHMEAEFTVANNSSYIKGINNLYEKDCGSLSGWRYCVNGWYPNYGCSRYQVQNGDALEVHYTCDFGRDLGGDVPEGN